MQVNYTLMRFYTIINGKSSTKFDMKLLICFVSLSLRVYAGVSTLFC